MLREKRSRYVDPLSAEMYRGENIVIGIALVLAILSSIIVVMFFTGIEDTVYAWVAEIVYAVRNS